MIGARLDFSARPPWREPNKTAPPLAQLTNCCSQAIAQKGVPPQSCATPTSGALRVATSSRGERILEQEFKPTKKRGICSLSCRLACITGHAPRPHHRALLNFRPGCFVQADHQAARANQPTRTLTSKPTNQTNARPKFFLPREARAPTTNEQAHAGGICLQGKEMQICDRFSSRNISAGSGFQFRLEVFTLGPPLLVWAFNGVLCVVDFVTEAEALTVRHSPDLWLAAEGRVDM